MCLKIDNPISEDSEFAQFIIKMSRQKARNEVDCVEESNLCAESESDELDYHDIDDPHPSSFQSPESASSSKLQDTSWDLNDIQMAYISLPSLLNVSETIALQVQDI